MTTYSGSCHCGEIAYEVEGTLSDAMECNCSHCSRKGYLLWFVPRDKLTIRTPTDTLATYTFNKHVIQHHFCSHCGCAPFGEGKDPKGNAVAAINVRCLQDVDRSTLKIIQVDGRSF